MGICVFTNTHTIDLDFVFIDFFFILKRRCNHWIYFILFLGGEHLGKGPEQVLKHVENLQITF